jgi:DNA mismatch repair ATPase MutL
MPIESLPESTKSSLLSTLALYTTPSLVKELLDNAYDANATSITVEISSNALDIIQVKDDGKGIRPEDAAKMGQRHCTSKLRKIEELQTLGDQSLGFRGEALASAVEMSRAVEVGSRVEGETVGRLWRIGNPEGYEYLPYP